MVEFVLDDFDLADTAVMNIVPPGQTEVIGTITFAGPGHPQFIELANRNARRTARDEAAKERARVNGKKWTPEIPDTETTRTQNIEGVVGRMLDWSGIKQRGADGTVVDVPFSATVARDFLLDRRKSWLFDAIIEFLIDEKSFTQRSAKT